MAILIVDDETLLRNAVKTVLENRLPGIRVHEASDEAGLRAAVDQHRPKLVFMDIHLPGRNGLRLTRRLKAAHPDITVAVWTVSDSSEYRSAAADAGADFFVSKKTESIQRLIGLARRIAADE